jgi:peptidoglycan/xylan/chitin deacetylase (PgdA/CDA1 family)
MPVMGLVKEAVTEEPWVSVTYDEHLGPNTGRILDTFADQGMSGTFFTLGEEANAHPELVRMILEEGHEIGNHAYHHRRLTQISDHGHRQYRKTLLAIEALTGFRTALARPPFGRLNDGVIAAAASLGMTTVKWSLTPRWSDNPRKIAEYLLDGVRPGQIILLHQNDYCTDALPYLLEGLREQGLRSVPATLLLGGRFVYAS